MKTIAILGAGPSGLVAVKSALEEGLQPIVFEKAETIGGVWRPSNESNEHGFAWPTMRMNGSRHTALFSDFAWPSQAPDYPTTKEVYDYLCRYADHFNLYEHINFGCCVTQVLKEEIGWTVCWVDKDNINNKKSFDYLIVATNKYTHPHIPKISGLETVPHRIHSKDFISKDEFSNKKVLVVGGSFSGDGIATEISEVATVIHLFRKPKWLLPRYTQAQPEIKNSPYVPRDFRKTLAASKIVVSKEDQFLAFTKECERQNKIPEWAMRFDCSPGYIVSDGYLERIESGNIIPVHGEINDFDKSRVILQDNKCIEFDSVVLCTGYETDFSYLPHDLQYPPQLYEDTLHPYIENIAYLCIYQGLRGSVFPLIELQARYACRVFSGNILQPSQEQMLTEISKTPRERDGIRFMTDLATKLEVIPELDSNDSKLYNILLHAPFTCSRFRLVGPHNNPLLARKMLFDLHEYKEQLYKKNVSIAGNSLFAIDYNEKPTTQNINFCAFANR